MKIKNKKVLVTGADGFIGSHLVETLIDKNCEIKAFVYYNSFNSWGWLDALPKEKLKKIEIISGDIRDENQIRKSVKDVDIVFHLAALIAIPFSYHAPSSYIDTNIKGTLNILQAAMDSNVKRIITTSTSEVYGTALYVPIDEKHPKQPQSPYSASKIGADSLAESFYRSFNIPLVIARPFNTYGPRQSARAIIPTIIIQLLNGKKEIKLGSLHPTRDFTYVLDTCEAFVRIAECNDAIGESVNFGTGSEISMKNLIELIIELTGSKAKIITDKARIRPKKSEVERLVSNNSLMKELTGWQPKVSIREGIRNTIEWFENKENLMKYKTDIYNI